MIRFYYLATALFLLLDLALNINVRLAFLENHPGIRAAYYAVIFTCMALIIWRPSWTVVVSGIESLAALVALILTVWLRVLAIGDPTTAGGGFASTEEMVNFVMTGTIAYLAYQRGIRELHEKTRT